MKVDSLRNFAIISSPFQLLNLKELIDEKSLKSVFVIAIFKSDYEITKIKAVSNFTNLKISRWVKSSFIMTHVKLFFIGLKLNKVKNFIFSSLFDNRMLLLSKLTKYQNIILIDDGTEAIAALKSYEDNTNLFDSNLLSILTCLSEKFLLIITFIISSVGRSIPIFMKLLNRDLRSSNFNSKDCIGFKELIIIY